MTTREAVDRSITHDEIVTIQTADRFEARVLVSELQAIAFDAGLDFIYELVRDSVHDRYETWAFEPGTDYEWDGMAWRVHVEIEA